MNGTQPVASVLQPRLVTAAKDLISRLSRIHDDKYAFSTASVEVYDTAWVAMVTKGSGSQKQWLFPECFHYLLKSQADDGSWGYHPQTKAAGVLGTGASLLALLKHLKEPLQITDVSVNEIRKRISLGSKSLRVQLEHWDDVLQTNHIGIELVAPALLEYLEQEDPSLKFQFPAQAALQEMNAGKMARFKPEHLYQAKVATAAHSLEAFIGKIDFDRVSGHLWRGSMMASPSSTAAYLMHSSIWDDEAEGFLKHVLTAGAGHGDGGMPGTFPTSYFEYSWSVVTLLQAGFSTEDLGRSELDVIADHLEKGFKEEGGIIGFAPRAPDADDTAKGLLALDLMGRHISPDRMIKVFEGSNHFTTFGAERDPSLTSNCHILLALLHQPDVSKYYPQITKTANFLCDFWWTTDGHIKDKWHLSHMYPTMLMAEAFTELLRKFETGEIPESIKEQLLWRVCISLYQACLRTLLEQDSDGSWGGMPEQTSYAIITLAEARKLSFFGDIADQVQAAIDRGARYLENYTGPGDASWTSKSAYRVALVAEAYELAALNLRGMARDVAGIGHTIDVPLSGPEFDGYVALFKATRPFLDVPEWQLRASLFESSLFIPLLKEQLLTVFSKDEFDATKDKYLKLIPFAWISCNNMERPFSSTKWLYEMMLMSMLSYQADEFLHNFAAPALKDPHVLRQLIDGVFDDLSTAETASSKKANGHGSPGSREAIRGSLGRFVRHVLDHPSVVKSCPSHAASLRRELQSFLGANVAQIEENARFAKLEPSPSPVYTTAQRTFFDWLRTTASDRTAIIFPFFFGCCHLSSQNAGADMFGTAAEKYLLDATMHHLANKGRLMNDFGSVNRDSAEGVVNSVFFPEFDFASSPVSSSATDAVTAKKVQLQRLICFEEQCLAAALELLEKSCLEGHEGIESWYFQKRKLAMVTLYRRVSDLYGYIYMLKGTTN